MFSSVTQHSSHYRRRRPSVELSFCEREVKEKGEKVPDLFRGERLPPLDQRQYVYLCCGILYCFVVPSSSDRDSTTPPQ